MRNYLVPIDFTKYSDIALDYAVERAKRRGARLILLHVLVSRGASAADESAAQSSARFAMRKLVEKRGLSDRDHRVIFLEHENAARAIAEQARKSRVRMIIMGSEGRRGMRRLLASSVAEATLRETTRPLLIVKRSRRVTVPVKLILVAMDASSASKKALRYARAMAGLEKETLLLYNVVTDTGHMVPFYLRDDYEDSLIKAEQTRLRQLAHELALRPRHYRTMVVRGRDAAAAIIRAARTHRASMIVMGSQGRKGLTRLALGSVAEKTVRQASCPVLILKS